MDCGRKNGVLYVRTFGGFVMQWNGTVLDSGGQSNKTQYARLMQMLLHYRERGVSRENLEETLFGGKCIANAHHALQSVVYNAKRRLEQAGLPGDDCIASEKGIFYWTDRVPAEEDALRFEQLCERAGQEQEENTQLELYLTACACYTGDFLAGCWEAEWVKTEKERYRAMFCRCVKEAAEILRKREAYDRLEDLSRHVSRTAPFAEWEVLQMEALAALGKGEEAERLYRDTEQRCLKGRRDSSSRRLLEKMKKLEAGIKPHGETLDGIQKRLTEEESGPGGYLCSYAVFKGIYSIMKRMAGQGGQNVYLMSCVVVDGSGIPMQEGKRLEELSERLETAVCESVSREDAVSRYGRGQYLILLFDRTREECRGIQKRITRQFMTGRQRIGVRYYIRDVV